MKSSLVALALVLVVVPVAAAADARIESVEVAPGATVLPITGLQIVLPKDSRAGFTWNLSSSYSLTDGGASFDGRDIVDEKVNGALVAGNWVVTGHFAAEDCAAVLAGVALADAWSEERTLYRLPFSVRGGTFDFGNDLGKAPSVAVCTRRADGSSLLLQHFFLDRTAVTTRESIMAELPKLKVFGSAAKSWHENRWGAVTPRRRPEVKERGAVAAVRTVTLAKTGLTLTLPDDGYVWLIRAPAEGDAVDWFDRMAPALNEISLEVTRLPDSTCAAAFARLTAATGRVPGPKGLPAGWVAGPALAANGALERSACHEIGNGTILVGLFTIPDKGRGAGDFGPLAPLLKAISTAAVR